MLTLSLGLLANLFIAAPLATASKDWNALSYRRSMISEVGNLEFEHTYIPCNASAVGSVAACFNSGITASNNVDWPWGSSIISYPTTGAPWGIHIIGPAADGVTYTISWHSGSPQNGPVGSLTIPNTSSLVSQVRISTVSEASSPGTNCTCAPGSGSLYTGKVITYLRNYTLPAVTNWSYVSPLLSHVPVKLSPSTTYYYIVGDGVTWSAEYNFTTLATVASPPSAKYPLTIGLLGDIGQTDNSTITRDNIYLHKPDVVLINGDLSYADDYGAADNNTVNGGVSGTNQNRWDSFHVLWQKLFSVTPTISAAGNHELETADINAVVTPWTTSFSFPSNYPFQTYSSRWPVPGVTSNYGNINNNLYFSTVIGGVATVVVLNNYAPFYGAYTASNGTAVPATPQYTWAVNTLKSVNRTQTPWLFVITHSPIYHTYFTHYKEQDCFRSHYESLFYKYGVDIVLHGHVHAYERTHGMFNYTQDSCGPMYITIGDGGNIEGPYRNFVDEINPSTNATYCAQLSYSGKGPNGIAAAGLQWGPSYQTESQPLECPTVTWQPASGILGGPPLVLLNTSQNLASPNPVGFCQSSQPSWSAYRDPSFGHGILTLLSDSVAQLGWYRNIDGGLQVADSTIIERQSGCDLIQASTGNTKRRQALGLPPLVKKHHKAARKTRRGSK